MKLRSNLGFLGNTNDKIISVQLPGTNGKTLKIKPEELWRVYFFFTIFK